MLGSISTCLRALFFHSDDDSRGHEHVFLPIARPLPSTENSTLGLKNVPIPLKKRKRRVMRKKGGKKKGGGGGPKTIQNIFKIWGKKFLIVFYRAEVTLEVVTSD